MSRDPLEELFGPLDADDTETGAVETAAVGATEAPTRAYEPTPAAPRPAVQSPPRVAPASTPARRAAVRDEPDAAPTRPVPAARKSTKAAMPWIVVSAVAVLALGGAFVVVNALGDDEPKPEPTTEAPTPAPTTAAPEKPETETPKPGAEKPGAPEAEVGPNPISMDISYAGISVESSQKLTNPQWFYLAGPPERVMFESGLMNSFPDACSAMRSPVGESPWGIEKSAEGKWTVVRPAGTCSVDEKLYDEVWGLMQALADSAKPL